MGGAFLSEEDPVPTDEKHAPFYMLTIDGEVKTYTRAEWDDFVQDYVHRLIPAEDYAEAKKAGKDAREVTL